MSLLDPIRHHLVAQLRGPPWHALPAEFERLGLPWRERAEVGKEKHLTAIFQDLDDATVLAAGRRVLAGVSRTTTTGG